MVRLPYTAGGISFVVPEPAIIAAPLLNVLSGLAVVGMSSTQIYSVSAWLSRGRNGVARQVSGVEGPFCSRNLSCDSIAILDRKNQLQSCTYGDLGHPCLDGH